MAFATAQDLPRETCATPADDPLCPTKNAFLDYRLGAMGPRLPVAAGHKGGPRRGKSRTGGRRWCSFLVWFLLAATVLMVDVVQAVFTPDGKAALKAALLATCTYSGPPYYQLTGCTGGCLGENSTGYCPEFAASDDATGNPNGVMGDWDVSKVTDMQGSTSTYVSTTVCSLNGVTDFFF